MSVMAPQNSAQLSDMIRNAHAHKTRLRIHGGGTRQGLGQLVDSDAILSTKNLCGIVQYDPGSLYIVVRAGTPMPQIDAALDAAGQRLAFEPPDYSTLFAKSGIPSIGGAMACNLSGPRRVQAGAARDHILGVQFVDGQGVQVKSGGRVMKNVTGLDLAKLMCGAYGTLGVLCEVALKTLPKPNDCQTLAFAGLDYGGAVDLFTAALKTPYEVSGATWYNNTAYLRVEGTKLQVKNRIKALRKLVANVEGKIQRNADAHWVALRDLHPFAKGNGALWRLSCLPSDARGLVDLLHAQFGAKVMLDWAGGLIWAQMEYQHGQHKTLQKLLARHGGHATLIQGDEGMRAKGVFQPTTTIQDRITRGLRSKFDPKQILNPGIMG